MSTEEKRGSYVRISDVSKATEVVKQVGKGKKMYGNNERDGVKIYNVQPQLAPIL